MNESHEFGGGWTQIKLDVLSQYLAAYSQVMKNQKFKLLYIDAFAGTGDCKTKGRNPTDLAGSARRALESNCFDHYLFIEAHKGRNKQLRALCQLPEFADKSIQIEQEDANVVLSALLGSFDNRNWRAVAFLDPYGLNVNWKTLESIATTGAIDVWFLFSTSGLTRNAARKWSAVDKSKEEAIDRALGTPEWRTAFYTDTGQLGLFESDPHVIRTADIADLEKFVGKRLQHIFPDVLDPLRLPKSGSQLFSLFFAISNPAPNARGIAKRIASHIISNS